MEYNYNQQPVQPMQPPQPLIQLRTDRSLLKLILLSLITCGIYPLFFYTTLTDDVNIVCSRYDGKKSMHYLLMVFLIAPITCGIGGIVWLHNISNRIGNELLRRGIPYSFSATDYWLWSVLGSMLCGIGPLVYTYKLIKAVNLLNADFNARG